MESFTKNGTAIGTYTYNAQGQLVVRSVVNSLPGGTTVYFYDQDGHVTAEYDGVSGALLREYIWLNDLLLAIIDDDQSTTPATYYVHTGHLNHRLPSRTAQRPLWPAGCFDVEFWDSYGNLHS